MLLQATYFDGVSAEGYPAKVSLSADGFRISYRDGYMIRETAWELVGIHRLEFRTAAGFTLEYGLQPFQSLEFKDAVAFAALKEYYPHAAFLRSPYLALFSMKWQAILILCLAVLGIICFGYAILLPWGAMKAAEHLPPGYERWLGGELQHSFAGHDKIDTVKTGLVQRFVNQLTFEGGAAPSVTVVRKRVANAFALPGGYVVVYDSILGMMKTPDELAALIGHEYAHSYLRHTSRLMVRSLAAYVVFAMFFGDVSGVSASLLQNADQLTSMQYSRSLESQADAYSLKLLSTNHLHIDAMEELLNHLAGNAGKHNGVAWELLSTHPIITNRIEALAKLRRNSFPVCTVATNDSLDYYWKRLEASMKQQSANNNR